MFRLRLHWHRYANAHQNPKDMSARTILTAHTIAALFLLGIGTKAQAPAAKPIEHTVVIADITVDNLARELQSQGISFWRVVLAQAIIETGWEFNSNVYRNTNNFIGMRVPGSRPSMRVGSYHGYSAYTSWQDCVADIRLWQDNYWNGGTRDAYIAKMNRVWAEAPDYGYHINKLVKKLDERFPAKA